MQSKCLPKLSLLPFQIAFCRLSSASSAVPFSGRRHIRILRREQVTKLAVCLMNISGWWRVTAKHVCLMSDGFKVGRIHAMLVRAASRLHVVKFKSGRDWSYQQFVRESMSEDRPFPIEETSVAFACGRSCPKPAGFRFIDIFPKSDDGIDTRLRVWIREVTRLRAVLTSSFQKPTMRNQEGLSTIEADAFNLDTLTGHFWNLHNRFRGAMAQGVSAPLGFSLCLLYPIQQVI